MKKIIFILFFICIKNSVNAQTDNFEYKLFNQKDGLNGRQIFGFDFDDRNFLWVSTENGLNRYDGSEVVSFKNNFASDNLIITRIVVDKNYYTWFTTFTEPGVLIGKKTYPILINNKEKLKKAIQVIKIKDSIYFITSNKVYTTKENFVIEDYEFNKILFQNKINNLVWASKTNDGTIYLQTSNGLFYYSNSKLNKIAIDEIQGFPEIINDTIWASTYKNKTYAIEKKFVKEITTLKNKTVYKIYNNSKKNEILIASDSIYILKQNKIVKKLFTSKKDKKYPFVDVTVDKHYNYWFSTPTQLFLANETFMKSYSKVSNNSLLSNKWVSESGEYFENSLSQSQIKIPITVLNEVQEIIKQKNINDVTKIVEIDNNTFYLGTIINGIFCVKYKNNKLIKVEKLNLPIGAITKLQFNKKNKLLWILSTNYIAHLKIEINKLKINLIEDLIPYCIYEHHKDTLIGTESGIHYIKKGKLEKFVPFKKISSTTKDIISDKNGNLFIGTIGQGLFKIIQNNNEYNIVNLSNKHNINSTSIYDLKYNNGKIWTINNDGIYIFNEEGNLLNAIKNNLLNDNFFEDFPKLFFDSLGNCFAVNNKILVALPNKIKNEESFLIDPYIKYIIGNNHDTLFTANNINESVLKLDYKNNSLNFKLGINYFLDKSDLIFKSRLIPDDDEWHEINNSYNIFYKNLQPGEYIFELQCKLQNSSWSKVKKLRIIIDPPWYKSKLAICFWLTLIVLITYLIIKWRLTIIKSKNALKLAKIKEEFHTILAHDLSNPFKSYLDLSKTVSNLLHQKDYKSLLGIIQQIEYNSNKTLLIIDNILSWSKHKNSKPNETVIEVNEIFDQLIELYQNSLKSKQKEILFIKKIPVLVKEDSKFFNLLIRNLIDNAIKYSSDNTKITINETFNEKESIIEISNIYNPNCNNKIETYCSALNLGKINLEDQANLGLGTKFILEAKNKLNAKLIAINNPQKNEFIIKLILKKD